MSDYECMTTEELADWTEQAEAVIRQAGKGTLNPCTDCPMWFHLQEQAAGRCDRWPVGNGRPMTIPLAERTRKRDWMRAYRGSQRLVAVGE